jgi:thymidylate kinase
VVLVGPDGVGKTTVARALTAAYAGPTAYFHFLPVVGRTLPSHPGEDGTRPPPPGEAGARVLGWVRLLRNLARCLAGYFATVRPACRRGALVVGDRWIYGYLVQPQALRFYGPHWVAEAAIRLVPPPDLVVNLSAPAETVLDRKQELTPKQVAAELTAWSGLRHGRVKTFDATEPPAMIATRILEALR